MILRSSILFVILVLIQLSYGDLTKDRLQKSVSIFNVIKVITELFIKQKFLDAGIQDVSTRIQLFLCKQVRISRNR